MEEKTSTGAVCAIKAMANNFENEDFAVPSKKIIRILAILYSLRNVLKSRSVDETNALSSKSFCESIIS